MKKTLLIRSAVIVSLLLNVSAQAAHDKHLVPTPPMGWNSWNCVGYDVTEELVCGIADAIVESGMKDAGYTYVVIDDVWHKGRVDFKTFDAKGNQIPAGKNVPGRDANGTLIADPNKFPRGIAFVADYVHARGLKFGLYTVPGTRTCAGCSGSEGYEQRDLEDFAAWGVDFIKLDHCGVQGDTREIMKKWRQQLDSLDRPIVLSVNMGIADWMGQYADMWRTTTDIMSVWSYKPGEFCLMASIADIIDLQLGLESLHGQGGWNDPDMLQVGNSNLSEDENKAHFGMWCILGAPLIAGNDIRKMNESTRKILTNRELIAIDQDGLGHRGEKIRDLANGRSIWAKRLADPTTLAVAMLNASDEPADITLNFKDIGIDKPVCVRDLYAHKDLGKCQGSYTAGVPAHGIVVLKVTAFERVSSFVSLPVIPADGAIFEAEDPVQYFGCGTVLSKLENYTGTGYVQSENHQWRSFEMVFIVPAARGDYKLQFRYAAPNDKPLNYTLIANNDWSKPLEFPPTDSWSDWQTVAVTAPLKDGYNQVRITAAGPDLNTFAIDHLKVIPIAGKE